MCANAMPVFQPRRRASNRRRLLYVLREAPGVTAMAGAGVSPTVGPGTCESVVGGCETSGVLVLATERSGLCHHITGRLSMLESRVLD